MSISKRLASILIPARPFVGLDIGQHAVKIVALSPTASRPTVIATHLLDREAEGIIDDQDLFEHLKPWLAEHGLLDAEIVAGIPQHVTNIQISDFPPQAGDALDAMVAFQTRQLADLSEETFHFDYQTMPPYEQGEVPVLIGICLESIIEDRASRIAKAGIPLADLGISGLAFANACFHIRPETGTGEQPDLLIDIGSESASLVVAANGRVLFAGSLGFGASRYARELAQLQDTPRSRSGKYQRGEIAVSALQQLVHEVQAAISCWQEQDSHTGEVAIGTVVLGGGGALLPDLVNGLANTFDFQTDIIAPDLGPDCADPTIFTTAFGLALQARNAARLSLSLAPTQVKWNAQRRRRTGVMATATVLFCLALVLLFSCNLFRLHRQRTHLAKARQSLGQCEVVIKRLETDLAAVDMLERIQAPLVEHGNRARRFADAIEAISQAGKSSDWFVYIADRASFDSGKEPAPDSDAPPLHHRPPASIPGNFLLAPEKANAPDALPEPGRNIVTQLQPLTGMIVAGYTPLQEEEVYQRVRSIVGILNSSDLFTDVDLLPPTELRGREAIFDEWREFLYGLSRRGPQRYRPFALGVPFTALDIAAPPPPKEGSR